MNRRIESIEDESLDSIKLIGAFTECADCYCEGWKHCKQKEDFTKSDANFIEKSSLTTACSNCNHDLSGILSIHFFILVLKII